MDAPESQGNKQESGQPAQTGIGPIAGAVIVVLLVALGGIYFLIQERNRLHTPPVEEQLNA